MNSSAETQWAVSWGGTGTTNPAGEAIALDSSGNVYTAGHFKGTADLDSGAGTNNVTSAANIDTGFMVKHNSSGTYQWGKALPVTASSRMYGLAVKGSTSVHLSGYFQGTMDFDTGSGTVEIASEVGWDAYKKVADQLMIMLDNTGLLHGYSFNSWSDVVTYDNTFVEEWLASPQTSLYYSLQVMGDVQDKSDAYAALDKAEVDDYLQDILGESEPITCDCQE